MDTLPTRRVVIITILLAVILPSFAKIFKDSNTLFAAVQPGETECQQYKSCNSCLSSNKCVWCVNKAKCTTDSCGNDNIIFPSHIRALMAGVQFCPRVVLPEDGLMIQSGKDERIVVKITQVYMYMAFTPWKCKFSQDGKDMVINATLIADEVFCDPVKLYSFGRAYTDASVGVLWEHSKAFDGELPLTICRCDLDPKCSACDVTTTTTTSQTTTSN